MSTVHIAVVSSAQTAALARLTARCATRTDPTLRVTVLDVDGSYGPHAGEVLTPADLGMELGALHRTAVRLRPPQLRAWLQPALLRTVLRDSPAGTVAIAVQAGVLLVHRPSELVAAAAEHGFCLLARAPEGLPPDGRWPDADDLAHAGAHTTRLVALRADQEALLDLWERSTAPPATAAERWPDVAASRWPHHTVRDVATLLSPWTVRAAHQIQRADGSAHPSGLTLDGRPVVAVDLAALDPHRPWLLDADTPRDPRCRLSDHPVLAQLVADTVRELEDGDSHLDGMGWDLGTTSIGVPVHPLLRDLYAAALDSVLPDQDPPPDPYDPQAAPELAAWLADPADDGGPGRYLRAIHGSRPDLQTLFPGVPGEHTPAFLSWVREHGRTEEAYSTALIDLALARVTTTRPLSRSRPAPGVNVVGYLRGELGIGESARLMVSALHASGVPHAATAVDQHLASRQRGSHRQSAATPTFDTTLVCVNADLTPAIAATIPGLLARSYRIGMWYWEVEEFPASQHGGFDHVDEVWVATDFVRRAIEPHSPVPVRTVTPPLPQRGERPTVDREHLGLPDRPLFLFSFDYLSTAERKNAVGLVDAFTRAFAPGEDPVLVVKSINADQRPAEAERLRLRAASAPDVILMESYLDADQRDALVALCDCYVSLHRSEGLGLTIAEAMAWGKPVIATAYSGNLQFMTEENSFLVPWTPAPIPDGAQPYPPGGVWADPDLDAAAALMRGVLDHPEEAKARGARAAQDISTRHTPEAAGRAVAARLAEIAPQRRARARETFDERLRTVARRARAALP